MMQHDFFSRMRSCICTYSGKKLGVRHIFNRWKFLDTSILLQIDKM